MLIFGLQIAFDESTLNKWYMCMAGLGYKRANRASLPRDIVYIPSFANMGRKGGFLSLPNVWTFGYPPNVWASGMAPPGRRPSRQGAFRLQLHADTDPDLSEVFWKSLGNIAFGVAGPLDVGIWA